MVPFEELNQRIKYLQAAMQKEDIALTILIQRADLFYFSGTGQNAHLLVPDEGEPLLVVKKSMTRARQESALKNIIPFKGWEELAVLITDKVRSGSKIGMETDVLPVNLFNRYQKLLSNYQLIDISRPIRRIRSIKSNFELEKMKTAAKISKAVLEQAYRKIREGISEVELAAELEKEARALGHQGAVRMRGFNQELYYGHIMAGENAAVVSFFDGPTGGSGLNPSFPQGAGKKEINANEPVLVAFVSVYDGYMVDQTRVFSIGIPRHHLREAYHCAVTIKKKLAEAGKPGVSGSALFNIAEDYAKKSGLANHFMGYTEKVNFVGHGVGIELDELPVIARGLEMPLEEGMVFALEPKFIFPGEGTVGIEDTFVVRAGGLEQITDFSDELQIL